MKTNLKAEYAGLSDERLAGGAGALAAKEPNALALRRSVMACLLWEKLFYQDGVSVVDNIKKLIPLVDPLEVARIAVEARMDQKLRHVPLLVVREMARYDSHKGLVGTVLPQVVQRADELSEFLAIYWKEGKQPLSSQVKKGLATAFTKFNEYQLAKYNRDNAIKLRDVLFLVHAKPKDKSQAELWKRLVDNELAIPDTWETELSAGKDKKATFTRLIMEGKLGALAFVRNLRNMIQAGVDRKTLLYGFENIDPRWMVPLDFLKAVQYAPDYMRELESMMMRSLANAPKLSGHTIMIVDESGSMRASMSSDSQFTRMEAAFAMAVLASGMCEHISVYATAGNDSTRVHKTLKVKPYSGFALRDALAEMISKVGGGGIFTRQALEYVREDLKGEKPDRIIVFSDSQDCDWPNKQIPNPFGTYNYIVDVSSHNLGINYQGRWTAEISGWSEHFLKYIAAYEGVKITEQEE